MILIGEKINGAIPSTAAAIAARDDAAIAALAKAQTDAGADYLDVCAGVVPELEYAALCWLIGVVQDASALPLCVDSPDPHMIERVLPLVNKPGLINSISLEGDKCETLLPLLKDNPAWGVIALCCDSSGIAAAAEDKTRNAFTLIDKAAACGIPPERMHIDPLVLALSAVGDSAVQFCRAIELIKTKEPRVHVTAALSNISFGMPARSLVNRHFMTMAMLSGLDSVIADPTNREVIGAIRAADALMGNDRFCRRYNGAYRAGKIGAIKK